MVLTYQVKKAYVRKEDIIKALRSNTIKKAKEIADSFAEMMTLLEQEKGERFVEMESPRVWFDRDVAALWPYEYKKLSYGRIYKTCLYDIDYITYADILRCSDLYSVGEKHFDIPTIEEVQTTFDQKIANPIASVNEKYIDCNGTKLTELFVKNGDSVCFYWNRSESGWGGESNCEWRTIGGQHDYWRYYNNANFYIVPIFRLKKINASAISFSESVKYWLKFGLLPEKLKRRTKLLYKNFMDSYKVLGKYIDFDDNRKLVFDTESFVKAVENGTFTANVFDYDFNFAEMEKQVLAGKRKIDDLSELKQQLLACDQKRANLRIYPEKRLTDQGHWDLCEEPKDKEKYSLVQIDDSELMLARPPQLDVKPNKVCGIDFGTKSTVVAVYENDEYLLRIGQSDLTKAETGNDYENPTIIECRDLEAFMKAYREKEGRPYTEWEQITVSHTAREALKSTDSSVSKCIFTDLKQWTHDGSKRYVRDRKGKLREIKPFLQLDDDDFNPLEIYAYYLGLYINNMDQGICLEYVMSFPVNFEERVRDMILKAFDRGLNKALPASLAQKVHVYAGASEPAAYAITALKELQLQPKKKEEECAYGVFDFGGGTTDFDFGIENINIPKRGKPYIEIHQLGNGGNPYLGGENILELMAYQVYKENFAKMKQKRIAFVLPALGDKVPFSGAELFVKEKEGASQAAYLNCKHLAEELRYIWEREKDYKTKYKSNPLKLIMYADEKSKDNSSMVDSFNRELTVNVEALEQLVKKVIENGIVNFFAKCRQSFEKYADTPMPIHILLAGNSSKSPVVEELFRKHMAKEEQFIKSVRKNVDKAFELHLPLGSENKPVADKMENKAANLLARNQNPKNAGDKAANNTVKQDALKPLTAPIVTSDTPTNYVESNLKYRKTGKTGVAFGLLQSRSGARKYVVINEIADGDKPQFKYYIGSCDLEDNFQVDVMLDEACSEWKEFLPADEQYFDLYYTSEAKSVNGDMPIKETMHAYLKIDEDLVTDDENTNIYIRKVDSETIEYIVAKDEDIIKLDKEKLEMKVYKVKL